VTGIGRANQADLERLVRRRCRALRSPTMAGRSNPCYTLLHYKGAVGQGAGSIRQRCWKICSR
jgi:hypothetical protein